MTDDNEINRRTVLKGAAVSGAGFVGASAFSGSAVAGGPPEGNGPCHKDFECEEGDGTYVKFEFVIETDDDGNITDCYFEEETDTGLVEITDWWSKDGEECEPVKVEWEAGPEASGSIDVTNLMAYGGTECDTVSDPDGMYESGLENEGGNTAAISNLQFCVVEILELPVEDVYVGYEDRPASGDFDYNDFGMDANIQETYVENELSSIEMEFTSRVHEAGDSHDIHIERSFDNSVDWDLTVSRDDPAVGNEDVGSSSGSGSLDVVLFDTDSFTPGDTVTLSVEITSGSVSPPTSSPRPDVAANNPLFEVYDPWMDNRSQGSTIDLLTVQENVNKGQADWDGPSDVPNIVVVPVTSFDPPAEGVTITADYPEFDNYYQDVDDDGDLDPDPTYDDWYDTS